MCYCGVTARKKGPLRLLTVTLVSRHVFGSTIAQRWVHCSLLHGYSAGTESSAGLYVAASEHIPFTSHAEKNRPNKQTLRKPAVPSGSCTTEQTAYALYRWCVCTLYMACCTCTASLESVIWSRTHAPHGPDVVQREITHLLQTALTHAPQMDPASAHVSDSKLLNCWHWSWLS